MHGPECSSLPPKPEVRKPSYIYCKPLHSQSGQTNNSLSAQNNLIGPDDHPFQNLDLRLGRWDNRHFLKMFDSALVGDKFTQLSEKFTVCLATQSSLEKLFSIVQVAHHWTGPISTAVYIAGDEEFTLVMLYIVYLRKCHHAVRDRVNFHFAFPKDRLPTSINFDASELPSLNCYKPESTLQHILKQRPMLVTKWRFKNPYPQNHLRNLARKNCQGDYVFLTDVDIIPSMKACEGLDQFLRTVTCSAKCAYVIPTYELDERVRFPVNKSELVRLANKGLARPFHHKVFIYNQYATNISK